MPEPEPGFDAFLSYARGDDGDFRDALVAGLTREGFRVFFDRESLPSRGTTFDQELRRAIESSDRLLLVVGPAALASDYVAQEWGFADDLGLPVIPVLQAGTFENLPEELSSYHAVDGTSPQTVEAVVSELARLLSEPVQPLGVCHRVPSAAAGELARAELLDSLWLALGVDRQRPQDAGRAPRAAALYGVSGVGKSTIAAAFARSVRTRRSFPDGIVWVTCGPSFQPLAGAREILTQAVVGARLPAADDDVQSALAEGIGGKEILLVLDDVRDADAAAPFVAALGPGGRVLITALDQAVATALGAVETTVDRLDEASSRRLLEGWAGGPLPDEAESVLAACDGLPFALAIVGAMVQNRVPWARVVQALDARRLDLLAARFPGYPHPNLLRALAASYDDLHAENSDAAECYLELAAFRPGATLTESVMVRLWSRPDRLSELEASLIVPLLERRLLLHRQTTPEGERFVLHRLHEDFVRLECSDAAELEAALISGYREEKGAGDWSGLADDGYVYDHLIAHLVALGDRAELLSAANGAWVCRQLLLRGDLGQALDDVRLALDAVARPPLDLPAVARLSVLLGQVAATLREAPAALLGALAQTGRVDPALRWAADKPDPGERFEALAVVAEVLVGRGELTLARRVIGTAAATIPSMGGVVETGMFAGLTALNAVHALVDFPAPDEWEGTNDEHVALARIPVDAILRLAPIAGQAAALQELAAVRHPFWELYAHLIPLVAVEELAERGDVDVAGALLDRLAPESDDDDDMAHAAAHRYAVALAAVGRFEEARAAVDGLPESYRGVARRGIARHLAVAGRDEEAAELIHGIDDPTVADKAVTDLVEATIERTEPDGCRRVAQLASERDWIVAAAWLMAAAGEPAFGIDLLGRASRDEIGIGLGVRLGHIVLAGGDERQATEIARRLVPMAERLLGPQWFAPETLDAEPQLASPGSLLLSLLARTGEHLPENLVALAHVFEGQFESVPEFKIRAIVELAIAGRAAEARQLAEEGIGPTGRALGLAGAIASADPSTSAEELRAAARSLIETLGDAAATPSLDTALGAAVRILASHGLDEEAGRLVEECLPRPGLWSAVGGWALNRARAGEHGEVGELARRLLVERPLRAPDAKARARLLAAVAGRRSRSGDELAAAARLLADLAVAAAALDVVFEVVGLYASQLGSEAAGSFARGVAGGEAAQLAEGLLSDGEIRWADGTSEQEIAAAAAIRSVAAASMALATSQDGARPEAREWLERARALSRQAESLGAHLGAGAATAKYVGAALAEVDPEARVTEDPGVVLAAAWLLWNRGCSGSAVELARSTLDELVNPLAASPQVITTEAFERQMGVFAAARAALGAILAMGAAAQGSAAEARTVARAAAGEVESYGLLSLTPGERSEVHSSLAIALQRAGEREAAGDQLRRAVESAAALARRGELGAFERLCQAATEVLPPDEAALTWADWLVAAAEAGGSEAVSLIASYVRWLPERDLATVVVRPETGELLSAESRA